MPRLDDIADARRWEALQRRYLLAPKGQRQARLKALRDATHELLARDVATARKKRKRGRAA